MTEAVRRLGPEKAPVKSTVTRHVLAHVSVRFVVQQQHGQPEPPKTVPPGLDERRPLPTPGFSPPRDAYLGATELPEDDPQNKVYPGQFVTWRRTRHRRSLAGVQRPSAGDLIRDGLLLPPVPRSPSRVGGFDLRTAFRTAQLLSGIITRR